MPQPQRQQAKSSPSKGGAGQAQQSAELDSGEAARAQSAEMQALRPAAPGSAPAGNGSIAGQVPDAVDLKSVSASFTLPKGKNLSSTWSRRLTTSYQTWVSLTVTPTGLRVDASPGIDIDAFWPAQNMTLYGAGFDFQTASPNVDVRLQRGLGEGFLDYTGDAQKEIGALISRGVAGTAMAKPGYDPLTDQSLMATLQKLASNFQSLPSGGGESDVGPQDMQNVSAEATLEMRKPFEQMKDGAGLQIPVGGQFTVRFNGGASIADLSGAGSAAEGAKRAKLRSITLSSDALKVIKDGAAVAQLDRLRVDPGGQVTVESLTLLGKAKKASDFETLFRVLAGTVALAGQGVPAEAGLQIAASSRDAQATIVPGITRKTIEDALTAGVRDLLQQNAKAVPGVDLTEILGGGKAPGT